MTADYVCDGCGDDIPTSALQYYKDGNGRERVRWRCPACGAGGWDDR